MSDTIINHKRARPVVLCILDGWGWRTETEDNAIAAANTPVYDRLVREAPRALIKTSGLAVGLPEGQMGNSEVGHMNIGAGRVVMQDLPRIDEAIANGTFKNLPPLLQFIRKLKESRGTAHVLGLLSPGGVHAHQAHMAAFARALDAEGIPVRIHACLDGRDTPPQSAREYLAAFERAIAGTRDVRVASVSGRYYAMDRDKRWERVEPAYLAIAEGEAPSLESAASVIDASYAQGVTDEFVLPRTITGYQGMRDGDGLFMANFRADRARQILSALIDPAFADFTRRRKISFAATLGMSEYSARLSSLMPALFPPEDLHETLGEVVARAHLRQLRIAETEKYAHVTFFLNGGREDLFEGEERILVPSPKVATYDLQPEMSAPEVTRRLTDAILSRDFDLIVANFANPDMIGHTGLFPAAIQAVETIDRAIAALEAACRKTGAVMLLTADHGNIELMRDPVTREPHTAHTTFDVPVMLINSEALEEPVSLASGKLADIAPTVLALMGLEKPAAMTGRSLLVRPS